MARNERAAGRRIGENRARLGFAMTNGRRGHSARRSYRSKRDYVGLSVECLSRPGHLIRPRRGSFVFLVFQTRAAPRHTEPRRIFLLFLRFIARPLRTACSALFSIACSRLKYNTYWCPDMLNLISYCENNVYQKTLEKTSIYFLWFLSLLLH